MAVDIFVNFNHPEIKGESLKEGRDNAIEALSVAWSTNQQFAIGSQSSGVSAGKVEFGELKFTKLFDRTSPYLFLFEAQGKTFPKVTITFSRSGVEKVAQDFAILTLGQVGISTIETSATTEDVPLESIGLTYGSLVWQVATAQGPSGKATLAKDDKGKGWSRVKNRSITDVATL